MTKDPYDFSPEADYEHELKRTIARTCAVVAAASAGLATLIMGTVPTYRTVHEHKVVTTTKKEIIEKETVDLTNGCMQGQSGTVVRVHSEAYNVGTKDDPGAWIWKSFVTIKNAENINIVCVFEYVDMKKTTEPGDIIAPAGGERI